MRLLATGDWHAGVPSLALERQEECWHRIVDVAVSHRVDAFLHGGDLYQGPICAMEQIAAVRRVFNRLRAAGIPILIIRGNSVHDLAVRPVDALDLFRDYEGITVSTRPEVVGIGGVQVVTLPWARPGNVIAASNGALSHDQVSVGVAEALVEIATDLRAQALPAGPCVLMAHWAISGSSLPNGLPVDELRESVLEWAELDRIGFDAIIGAHIHEQQRLDHPELGDQTVGLVVGSPQQLNHGEAGEHGCWLVDIGEAIRPSGVHADFIPIKSQRFVTLDWDHGEDAAVYEEILNGDFSHSAAVSDNIVRIRFRATEEAARRIDHRALREALMNAGAAKVTIEPTIQRSARARSEAITDQLGPLDALDAYCEAQFESITNEMRGRMRATLAEWMTA